MDAMVALLYSIYYMVQHITWRLTSAFNIVGSGRDEECGEDVDRGGEGEL